MPDDFPIPQTPVWGTYVYGRRPEFKPHSSVGHARLAITNKFRWSYIGRDRQHGVAETDCALWPESA